MKRRGLGKSVKHSSSNSKRGPVPGKFQLAAMQKGDAQVDNLSNGFDFSE